MQIMFVPHMCPRALHDMQDSVPVFEANAEVYYPRNCSALVV